MADKRPRDEQGVACAKARFVRDTVTGDLRVIRPDDPDYVPAPPPAPAEKTAEDLHYERYLSGKQRGDVARIGGFSDGVDRAAAADSAAARDAEERERAGRDGKSHAPSHAYNRANKFKRGGKSSEGPGSAAAAAGVGVRAFDEAMKRAKEASDNDDDDDALSLSASELCDRAMSVYNEPISNLAQRDVHGNDLRLPKLERKLRKYVEFFAEEADIVTVTGQPVLRDLDAIRARYGTVFRESGAELRVTVLKRLAFAPPDGGACPTYALDFERHVSLVTPRPGLSLDGSMGVLPARTQELAVLYEASGGEITRAWISRDEAGLGADADAGRARIEESALYQQFRKHKEAAEM